MKHSVKNNVTITEGPIWQGLLSFFFPILFGTFFQQLYNTVDAIVVGQFIGKEALAAAGGGTAIYVNLLVGFFTGLSSGSTIIISQFFGAKRHKELDSAVHTAMWIAFMLGALMTAAGIALASPALKAINTPEDIFSDSVSYLRIFFTGIIPMFIYNMGAGILRATGDSSSPFGILVAGCFVNIALDLILVAALNLGIGGAAWATVVSQCICMIIILIRLRKDRNFTFMFRKICPAPHLLRRMLRLGLPTGFQATLYTVSNLIVQLNINAFGTNTVASWAAYGRIDAFFWMTASSFGIAITTFAGQNFGAQKYDRIKKATMQGLFMMSFAAIAYTVLFRFTGRYIYRLFTKDASVIEEGMNILHFLSPFFIMYIPIEVLSGTFHGAGETFKPMIITMIGVCALRILWLFTAVPLHNTLTTVIACYPVTWAVTSLAFFIYYARGSWLHTGAVKSAEK